MKKVKEQLLIRETELVNKLEYRKRDVQKTIDELVELRLAIKELNTNK